MVYNDFNNYPQFAPQKDFITESEHMDSLPSNTRKLLRDGQILILRGDKTYTITGTEVQ